jgi:hypothetical protein
VDLHHDGAAGRERAGRVAAGDAEGEREVAGREDGHRSDRDEHAAQVRPWGGGRVRIRVVDGELEVAAVGKDVGEQAQLVDRAGQLAPQPW